MPAMIQRSFTSGEIAPGLRTRADLGKYATALALCKNMIVRSQGGAYSRPGTRFVGEIGDSTKRARLIPFSFNTEQTYILVFEENSIRFVQDGAYIMDDDEPYEVTTTYTEEELPLLKFAQSADVLTLTHPNHPPANLSRLGQTNWTLTDISYAPTNSPPTDLVASDVGTGGGSSTKTYQYVVTSVDADGVESLPTAAVSITQNSLSATYGVELDWTAAADTDYYRVYKADSFGSQVYGFIGETRTLIFRDFNIAPDLSQAPPRNRTPFDSANNYPGVVNFYQQRQVFANTYNEPQTVFTTQTANFSSLRTSSPARADDAVTFTIAGRQVNEIRHIVSLDAMILMTSGGEWLVTEGQDDVLAPDTVGVRIQSYNGCNNVPPVVINDTVVFIQEKGARVRDLGYTFTSDKYIGNDLSIMSEHFFERFQIEEMDYAAEPYGVLWCVRDDGALLGMTYQREHEVWGWHQHDTQGEFESVAVITEGNRDAPYFIVKRTIDGVTKRYIERMEVREEVDAEECFYVDSGLTYRGEPATTLTGLDHLEGMEVAVLADGNVVNELVVTDGEIEIPFASSVVHVGLRYQPEINTLPLDSNQDVIKGKSFTVTDVRLEVFQSRGVWVGPLVPDEETDSKLIEVKPRLQSDGYGAIQLRTTQERVNIQPSWNKNGQIRIVQRDPLPLAVLAVIPEIDIGG